MADGTISSTNESEARSPADVDEELLREHEYDGIQEYDNPLPRWWVRIFWGTFVFALGYITHYHLTGHGPSVAESYVAEMSEAREAEARKLVGNTVTEEGLAKLMANAALMQDARKIFVERCVTCHADRGQGQIGPNLTDGYWIHGGGRLMDIYNVVNEGVPTKGMPTWGRQLSPIELQKVVGYVGTLRGTNIPGKKPEGNPLASR